MLKLCIILIALAVANCEFRCARTHKAGPCRHRHRQHGQNHRLYDRVFKELSSSVIATDREYQAACDPNHTVSEYYGLDFYTLRYSLAEFGDESVAIKTRHRVVYLSARNSTTVFNDIRILPSVVDAQSGQWYMEGGELVLHFNYRRPPKTETLLTCDAFVEERVRQVAKFSTGIELRGMDSARYGAATDSSIVFSENVV
ncbi:unnamed protein product, partial [Iphiclides podalirius]